MSPDEFPQSQLEEVRDILGALNKKMY